MPPWTAPNAPPPPTRAATVPPTPPPQTQAPTITCVLQLSNATSSNTNNTSGALLTLGQLAVPLLQQAAMARGASHQPMVTASLLLAAAASASPSSPFEYETPSHRRRNLAGTSPNANSSVGGSQPQLLLTAVFAAGDDAAALQVGYALLDQPQSILSAAQLGGGTITVSSVKYNGVLLGASPLPAPRGGSKLVDTVAGAASAGTALGKFCLGAGRLCLGHTLTQG